LINQSEERILLIDQRTQNIVASSGYYVNLRKYMENSFLMKYLKI